MGQGTKVRWKRLGNFGMTGIVRAYANPQRLEEPRAKSARGAHAGCPRAIVLLSTEHSGRDRAQYRHWSTAAALSARCTQRIAASVIVRPWHLAISSSPCDCVNAST